MGNGYQQIITTERNMFFEYKDDHPKREEMIVRAARYYGLTKAESFDQLEPNVRRLYLSFSYYELIRPLITYDRTKNHLSFGDLAKRYRIPKSTAESLYKKNKLLNQL